MLNPIKRCRHKENSRCALTIGSTQSGVACRELLIARATGYDSRKSAGTQRERINCV